MSINDTKCCKNNEYNYITMIMLCEMCCPNFLRYLQMTRRGEEKLILYLDIVTSENRASFFYALQKH